GRFFIQFAIHQILIPQCGCCCNNEVLYFCSGVCVMCGTGPREHPLILLRFQFESKPDAKPYKCTQCVKSFANSSYLSQHMRIHLGIKPFGPCQYCGKKFTQLSHLQQHIRTHTGEKPYKCKYTGCEKAFSQLSNLQSHSRCHQTDKPFKFGNRYHLPTCLKKVHI
ncbi:unnamed protein product, partial [Heligmosomoides polygyrus]|uniref:ZN362 protein n=1 Tax=Heligmosomoides polygyrus TaxID=6339 RepID=A0A183FP02_HELPZ